MMSEQKVTNYSVPVIFEAPSINRMLWQLVVLSQTALLGMRLAMVCVGCYVVTK